MIDNTPANLKFTNEQNEQINQVQTRLSNLQDEIALAKKEFIALRKDTDRVTKEKEYQESLLTTVSSQLEEKKREATKLDEEKLEKVAELNQLLVEFKEHSAKMEAEKMAMKDREDKLTQRENELGSSEASLSSRLSGYESVKRGFDSKVAKLKELINTF